MSQTKAQLIDPVDLSIVTADLADDAVTADKLASNAVVNASVDASAAIAGSKISPDFGSQNITTTGSITANNINANAGLDISIGSGTVSAIFPDNSQVNGITGMPSQAGTPFIVAKDTGTNRSAIFAGNVATSGKLGIGTTSPASLVHLSDDTDVEIRITNTDTTLSDGAQIGRLAFYTSDTTTPTGAGEVFNINSFSANSGADYTTTLFNRGGSAGGSTMLRFAEGEMRFSTSTTGNSATQKMVIDSSGRVGIGATSFNDAAEYLLVKNDSTAANVSIVGANNAHSSLNLGDEDDFNIQKIRSDHTDNSLQIFTDNTERMRINNGGDLLIGTTSDSILASFGSNTGGILVDNIGSSNTAVGVTHDTTELFLGADTDTGYIWQASNHRIQIATNDTRRVIITAGGQMGLGEVTETAIRNNGAGNKTYLVISKGQGSGNAPTTYNADEEYLHLGGREYSDGSGDLGQYFIGFGYTNGVAGDHSPCAIGMNTTTESGYTKGNFVIRTRSGTSQNSTTGERLTIQSNGNVTTVVGGFVDRSNAGVTARKDDSLSITRASGTPVEINRTGNDGGLIFFYQAGSAEGTITVSGSTVSYNGGHLSRWSQLQGISTTDKSARPTIYQGTVMSNLDELCTWEHADELWTEQHKDDGVLPADKNVGDVKTPAYTEINQQLNMTKVSDTEGDKDIAGVFWSWDDDDDEIVNDFYIAMTGDMVIRVAGSTTVQRGDLLISAGDGTAKPQADDIIRSSTIAKIISTNSTATYPDGSKAYPCVLMAC